MKQIIISLMAVVLILNVVGCGDDKTNKQASGGGGSTTAATVKAPPKGEKPKME